jgi:hypothetical protein
MKETKAQYKIMRAIEKQSYIGYGVIRMRKKENGVIVMENIPAKNYFP